MKKIFTFFAAAVLAVSVWADETPAVKILAASEMEQYPGIASIVWQGDSTVSAGYDVLLCWIEGGASVYPFCEVASSYSAFSVPGYPGYYGIDTKTVLQYGTNYTKIPSTVDPSVVAAWQQGWQWAVDESDLTLKAGTYMVKVEGINTAMETTETAASHIFMVVGKSQGIESIYESKKPIKFIDPQGNVLILRDGKTYTLSGQEVK